MKNRIAQLTGRAIQFVTENRNELFAGGALLSVATVMSPFYADMAGMTLSDPIGVMQNGVRMAMASFGFLGVTGFTKGLGEKLVKDPLEVLNTAGKLESKGKNAEQYLQKQMADMTPQQSQLLRMAAKGTEYWPKAIDGNRQSANLVNRGSEILNRMSNNAPEQGRKFQGGQLSMG